MDEQQQQEIRPKYYWESPDRAELNKAMVEFSKLEIVLKKDREVKMALKDRNGNVTGELKRTYVTLDALLHATKKPLAECGLYIEQHLAGDVVLTRLNHTSGQYVMSGFIYQKMDGNSLANELQKAGGGLTYIKRYSISALLGIPVDEDTDGADGSRLTNKQPAKPLPPKNTITPKPAEPKLTPEQELEALKAATEDMWNCPDIACLKSTWSKYKKYQKDEEFAYAKEGRKKQLEEIAAESTTITPDDNTIKFDSK